jgi:hypothetical protein
VNAITYIHSAKPELEMYGQTLSIMKLLRAIEPSLEFSSASRIRHATLDQLRTAGWSKEVRLSASSGITVTSMQHDTALCLQTGNMSRFYADLLKLQYLFVSGNIQSAVYIVFTRQLAKRLGSNLAHFERLVEELRLFDKVITVPILVVGLE